MEIKTTYPQWLVGIIEVGNKFRTVDYCGNQSRARLGFNAFCKDTNVKQIVLAVKHNFLVRKVVAYKDKRVQINVSD